MSESDLSAPVGLRKPAARPLWRALVESVLDRIDTGTVVLEHAGRQRRFGRGDPTVRVRVERERFYRRLVVGGSVGAGEAFMDGDWQCDDLVGLIRIMAINEQRTTLLDGMMTMVRSLANRITHAGRRNSRRGSRRNIAEHYDLSNEFFRLILDRHMMYSAAVFEAPGASLDQASEAKLERLCRKLELKPGDHLLEIGTGWGGLAIYAAQRFGCRVTTTTISRAQAEHARRRVADCGMGDRVTVFERDYRELQGDYDKIVSVEMVEAVGDGFLNEFFKRCDKLLRPGGVMVMQAITIADHRYHSALKSVDFIKKYIFPGSFIPSVTRLVEAAGGHTRLVLANLEDFAEDYARTLACWRSAMHTQRSDVEALGFDQRFIRMWDFYLAYCEGGFRERAISDVQLVFVKQGYRGQPWRARRADNTPESFADQRSGGETC